MKHFHGLPVWAWALVAVGGIGLGLFLRHRHAASTAKADGYGAYPALTPSAGAAVGTDPGSIYPGLSGGPAGRPGGQLPPATGHLPTIDPPIGSFHHPAPTPPPGSPDKLYHPLSPGPLVGGTRPAAA